MSGRIYGDTERGLLRLAKDAAKWLRVQGGIEVDPVDQVQSIDGLFGVVLDTYVHVTARQVTRKGKTEILYAVWGAYLVHAPGTRTEPEQDVKDYGEFACPLPAISKAFEVIVADRAEAWEISQR